MAMTTRDWVGFFDQAGIPSNEAATYALIFTQNRIQKNMLPDLNKEYLKDMGISLLGDVIAILKHAKHVHENNVRVGLLENAAVVAEPAVTLKTGTTAEKLMDFYNQKFKEAEECLKEMKSQQKEKKLVVKTEPRDSLGESSQAPPPTRKSEPKVVKEAIFKRLEDVTSTTLEANTSKRPCSIFSRLGDLSSLPLDEVKSHETKIETVVLRKSAAGDESVVQIKKAVVKRDPKKSKEKDFLKANSLMPLKITTQFSDDEDLEPEELIPKPAKKPAKPVQITCSLSSVTLKKRPLSISPDDERIKVTRETPVKKVRFGTTSTKVIDDSKTSTKQPVFVNHNIVPKFTAKRKSYEPKRIRPPMRSDVIEERPSKLASKMAADSIRPRKQSSVKARVGFKASSDQKNSILDRLG